MDVDDHYGFNDIIRRINDSNFETTVLKLEYIIDIGYKYATYSDMLCYVIKNKNLNENNRLRLFRTLITTELSVDNLTKTTPEYSENTPNILHDILQFSNYKEYLDILIKTKYDFSSFYIFRKYRSLNIFEYFSDYEKYKLPEDTYTPDMSVIEYIINGGRLLSTKYIIKIKNKTQILRYFLNNVKDFYCRNVYNSYISWKDIYILENIPELNKILIQKNLLEQKDLKYITIPS